jgi:hypothetical protein
MSKFFIFKEKKDGLHCFVKSVFYKKSDRLFQDGRLNDSRLIISYQYRVPYPRTYDRSI